MIDTTTPPPGGLHPVPLEPTPRETGDQLRRLAREVRDLHLVVARRTEATGELEAVACGLEPEQEIRARALDVAVRWCVMHGDRTIHGGLFGVADMAVEYIRDGGKPERKPKPPVEVA